MAVDKELLAATIDVIRQSLQADGGDVELVDVDDDGVVSLEMQGACAGCPLSSYDMSMGIERILKEHVSERAGRAWHTIADDEAA